MEIYALFIDILFLTCKQYNLLFFICKQYSEYTYSYSQVRLYKYCIYIIHFNRELVMFFHLIVFHVRFIASRWPLTLAIPLNTRHSAKMLDIDTQVTEAILHPFILTWEMLALKTVRKCENMRSPDTIFQNKPGSPLQTLRRTSRLHCLFCRGVQLTWVGGYKTQLFVPFAWRYPQHVVLAKCLNGFDISALCTKPLISILANRFITSFTQRFRRRYLRHTHNQYQLNF